MQPACRFVKIELSIAYSEAVVARERKRGFELFKRRDWC